MRDAAHDMFLLLPNGSPDCHIVKTTIQDPGHLPIGFEGSQSLTHGGQYGLDFCRFTRKAGFFAAQEMLREHAAMTRRHPNHRQAPITGDQIPLLILDLHQIRHGLHVGLAHIRPIRYEPDLLLFLPAQLLHSHLPQVGTEMLGIQMGTLRALSFCHPQYPLTSLLASAQPLCTRGNALRNHTPRRNDPLDGFAEDLPRSAIPDQGCEGLELLLERVRPTALPFHFPSPFCSLLPRFYHLPASYEWMSVTFP